MEFESLITYHSKDTANVKVFADRQIVKKLYMPPIFRYESIKKLISNEKVLSLGTVICNI
jgi:hypothetical protein